MSAVLRAFPGSGCDAVAAIEVDCAADGGGALRLAYRLRGTTARLRIPPSRPEAFADGLWRHTCFEAFVARPGEAAYREFNFCPSGEWAVYRFDAYRQPAEHPEAPPAPQLRVHRSDELLSLEAQLDAAALPAGGELQIGLCAVVEAADGRLGYWALSHPGEVPDFHRREGFVLTVGRSVGEHSG